jgi:hypothetical protein
MSERYQIVEARSGAGHTPSQPLHHCTCAPAAGVLCPETGDTMNTGSERYDILSPRVNVVLNAIFRGLPYGALRLAEPNDASGMHGEAPRRISGILTSTGSTSLSPPQSSSRPAANAGAHADPACAPVPSAAAGVSALGEAGEYRDVGVDAHMTAGVDASATSGIAEQAASMLRRDWAQWVRNPRDFTERCRTSG